jgi:hypothetical protein
LLQPIDLRNLAHLLPEPFNRELLELLVVGVEEVEEEVQQYEGVPSRYLLQS